MRVDFVEHNDKICDKIVAEIRTCQFLVADGTLQRAGVYFDAGFEMGLGRPVIWTCRRMILLTSISIRDNTITLFGMSQRI